MIARTGLTSTMLNHNFLVHFSAEVGVIRIFAPFFLPALDVCR